jgi:hypothetical protein
MTGDHYLLVGYFCLIEHSGYPAALGFLYKKKMDAN